MAASMFLNYTQYQHAVSDKKLMQGEISDLKYQINEDKAAQVAGTRPSPSPSESDTDPAPSPSASPTPSASPAVAGTSSINISHYNVHFTATDPIQDTIYAPVKSGQLTVAGLSTQDLVAKYPACTPGASALGLIVRRPKSQTPPSYNKLIKSIGNYNFYYVPPTTYCTNDQAGRNTLAAARAAIFNSALPTLATN